MAKPGSRRFTRYSIYTGGPDPLAPPVDLREALEAIGQDVMEGTSPRRALAELLRRGTKDMKGADRLAAEKVAAYQANPTAETLAAMTPDPAIWHPFCDAGKVAAPVLADAISGKA